MATHEFTSTVSGIIGRPSNLAAMVAAAAAAQLVGAGDAHAEIDTWDTAQTAMAAADVTVVFQTTISANQLRKALDTIFDFAVKSAKLIS